MISRDLSADIVAPADMDHEPAVSESDWRWRVDSCRHLVGGAQHDVVRYRGQATARTATLVWSVVLVIAAFTIFYVRDFLFVR